MSTRAKLGIATLVVTLLGITFYSWWIHGAPRRQSLASLTRLDRALESGNRPELVDLLIVPAAVRDRTVPEQSEFLAKALADEIAPAGLAVLRKHGAYGPLKKLFPVEAEAWANQAGVRADDCVAFRLERRGLRAEVVLLRPSDFESEVTRGQAPFRIVRVNNVKQMAEPATHSTTETNP
jgi:hypothetical protein